MKTLYEQLTDEQREHIDLYGSKYPMLTQNILDGLKNNHVIIYLTLDTAMNIYDCFLLGGEFNFNKLHNFFKN